MILEIVFWLSVSSLTPSDPLYFFPGCKPLPAVEGDQTIELLQAQPPQAWNKEHILRA